ncbi:MAG: hypothetical protein JJLCMIEE_01498 [Acidimicrobiales bacterium]|nr:MAG: hypothetical protein EDR02_06240 [Actinomycetota bacterium]MBV6508436.1 hypothetical protein [Acidimicrobiales bacterium]RIK04756.1 MAG: hypothetical protein DCC48_11935 [Acidobacteriota bacterium]
MAQTKSLLELLSDLAADPVEQASYNQDPASYLDNHGFGDVTGQEIAEAMSLVAETLPPSAAAGIRPLSVTEGDDGIESAVRQLDHLVDTAGPSRDVFVSDPASTVDSTPDELDPGHDSVFGAGTPTGPAGTDARLPVEAADIAGFGEGSAADGDASTDAGVDEGLSLPIDPAGSQEPADPLEPSALDPLVAQSPSVTPVDGADAPIPAGHDEGADDLDGDGLGDADPQDFTDTDLDAGFF